MGFLGGVGGGGFAGNTQDAPEGFEVWGLGAIFPDGCSLLESFDAEISFLI